MKQITRIGVYGVAMQEGKILVIKQITGPHAGKFDFPGGGMEFGETPEETLRREFAEEIAMEFDTLHLLDNLTATIDVQIAEPYLFHQIGLIYRVENLKILNGERGEFEPTWIDFECLTEEQCSALLWKYVTNPSLNGCGFLD